MTIFAAENISMQTRLSNFDTIIFDLGNVIVDLNAHLVLKRFAELAPSATKSIPDLIKDTQLLIDYETGRLTTTEFVAATNAFLGSEIVASDFADAWNLMIGDIPLSRLNLMRELQKTHQVLILSNTNELHEHFFDAQIQRTHGQKSMADHVHHALYSHVISLRKPKADIYEYVIDSYLQNPAKALFLDDKQENVQAAIDTGMQSIQVKYPDQIFEILSND